MLVSGILAAALYPFFSWNILIIFAGGVLIDIDHYLWYVYKFKKISLFECYDYFIDGMRKDRINKNLGILLIFHTIEFIAMMLALSFFNELALIFTIGLLSHYLLDGIFLYRTAKRLIANPSIIGWIVKSKIQKV